VLIYNKKQARSQICPQSWEAAAHRVCRPSLALLDIVFIRAQVIHAHWGELRPTDASLRALSRLAKTGARQPGRNDFERFAP
jgi:hypothetical protein